MKELDYFHDSSSSEVTPKCSMFHVIVISLMTSSIVPALCTGNPSPGVHDHHNSRSSTPGQIPGHDTAHHDLRFVDISNKPRSDSISKTSEKTSVHSNVIGEAYQQYENIQTKNLMRASGIHEIKDSMQRYPGLMEVLRGASTVITSADRVMDSDQLKGRLFSPGRYHQEGIGKLYPDVVSTMQDEEANVNTIKEEISHRGANSQTLVDGVFWSETVEKRCTVGYPADSDATWRQSFNDVHVTHILPGCGRMQNRLLVLSDGSKACLRYRPNIEQIQAEIYSYYLGMLLGLHNIVPTTLQIVNSSNPFWSSVKNDIMYSEWVDGHMAVITKFFPDLVPVYIPQELRSHDRHLTPHDVINKSFPEQCDLLQWSDLIIFDYLTSNLDRLVNNMHNAQWNENMMDSPTHNLLKDPISGTLTFLDNESGLFHGYRLLHKYSSYQESLLKSLCVFRSSTVQAITKLHKSKHSIGEKLQGSFTSGEIFSWKLPKIGQNNIDILSQRISNVYNQIEYCYSKYVHR